MGLNISGELVIHDFKYKKSDTDMTGSKDRRVATSPIWQFVCIGIFTVGLCPEEGKYRLLGLL